MNSTGNPVTELAFCDVVAKLGNKIDLFVCSASYEDRCLSVPTAIKASNVKSALILSNQDVLGNGKQNRDKLAQHFGDRAKLIAISKHQAIKTGDRLLEQFDEIAGSEPLNCVVDISCLTHEALLILVAILKFCLPKGSQTTFLYTPAKEYDPGTDAGEKWLSKGIRNLRSVLGYPGELLPSRKTHLVVLVGFEVDRTLKLIETMEPSSLSLGVGRQPTNERHTSTNQLKYDRLSRLFAHADMFEFSTRNPHKARDDVLKVIDKFPNQNIILAPMNTKISTLGVALAVDQRPEVQICYAPARIYNVENYSMAEDHCYLFKLD
jgi:hypothetical protein